MPTDSRRFLIEQLNIIIEAVKSDHASASFLRTHLESVQEHGDALVKILAGQEFQPENEAVKALRDHENAGAKQS